MLSAKSNIHFSAALTDARVSVAQPQPLPQPAFLAEKLWYARLLKYTIATAKIRKMMSSCMVYRYAVV